MYCSIQHIKIDKKNVPVNVPVNERQKNILKEITVNN